MGNGTVALTIKANGGAQRSATVTIAGLSLGISQAAPFPTADVNSGCPQQSAAPTDQTSIQFINLLTNVPITVFNPTPGGNLDQSIIPPESGLTQPTKVKTIWQISIPTSPCLASYTAPPLTGSSAIVRP